MYSRLPKLLLLMSSMLLVGAMTCPVDQVQASHYGPRQYYGSWTYHQKGNYHYRPYYYKPTPTFSGYRHHYVVYTKRDPKHYYYFNPKSRKYWGRCPVNYGDEPVYSMLKVEDRKETLDEIPEKAFPKPGALPDIPDTSDGATLDLPPDDLPPIENAIGLNVAPDSP
jgi:hypothetical protein